jgi:hypothetical protein
MRPHTKGRAESQEGHRISAGGGAKILGKEFWRPAWQADLPGISADEYLKSSKTGNVALRWMSFLGGKRRKWGAGALALAS